MTILDARPDREPVVLVEGHPWAGRRLLPAWVTYRDERGRTVLSWRAHYPAAWPEGER